jgi:hypothetical protein
VIQFVVDWRFIALMLIFRRNISSTIYLLLFSIISMIFFLPSPHSLTHPTT